jgi:uncharacterized membrane protein
MRINWGPAKFAGTHEWDRNFFLLMVGLVWLGIVMGFVPQIIHRVETHAHPYPLIVHFHAAAMVAWLCLLTAQVLLVRAKRTDLHRRLGMAGMYLYPLMVVLGVATAIAVNRSEVGTPRFDPGFISIQLADMLNFAVLASAAFWFRRIPSAHKRFMILATIFIADAGYGRWWGSTLTTLLSDGHAVAGYWANAAGLFLGDFLLVVVMGAYDLITRRRLHPAFIFGAVFGLTWEAVSVWLYVSPWWKPVAMKLLGL